MATELVKITAPSRVHFGLASLTMDTRRTYGGVGLALWHSRVVVTCERLSSDNGPLIRCTDESLNAFVQRRLKVAELNRVGIDVLELPPAHVGLGSKTAVAMACAEAALLVSGRSASWSTTARLAGRGGASGIGINSYYTGAFLGDGGHGAPPATGFVPSSYSAPDHLPKAVVRLPWPDHWNVWIARPSNAKGLHSDAEV
jgi:beta-ribofuranosylaminobenzene 5'-phosphate synthase